VRYVSLIRVSDLDETTNIYLRYLLTLLSLTTKYAHTATAPGIRALASVATGFIPVVMGLENVFGKTHNHRKVCKRTDYRCSTSPGGIRIIVFIFFQCCKSRAIEFSGVLPKKL
jgi:hypothetical protein